MRRRHAAAAALLGWAPAWGATGSAAPRTTKGKSAQGKPYGRRGDVLAAARSIAVEHSLDTSWVEATLAHAHHVPAVAQLIMPAATPMARNWRAYRARFVEPRRIDAGVRWWGEHAEWFELAHEPFGVAPEIVV